MDNWIFGLSLIALTIELHVMSVTFMAAVLHGYRIRLEGRECTLLHVFVIVISTFTTVGLLLAALHMVEAVLWAAVYLWVGALESLQSAILYSVDTIATRGASGLVLPSHWRTMGALEAANGVLLFGISTAFIFSVMQLYFQHLVFRAAPDVSVRVE